jgi:hypothetical protein
MELAKDLNDIYKNLENLWENIYPIMLFHILFVLAFIFTTGLKLFSSSQVEKVKRSEKFSGLKTFIVSTGLKEKFTWTTLILAIILYLVVFSGLFKIFSSLNIPLVSIKPSINNFYKTTKPINAVTEIAIYSSVDRPSLRDIETAKGFILQDYQSKNPQEYQEGIGIWDSELSKDKTIYYLLVLSFILAAIIIAKSQVDKKRRAHTYMRCSLFLLLNLIAILNLRWWIEQDIEASFVARTNTAFQYVSNGQFGQTRSHSINKDIFDTSGHIDKVKVTRVKDSLRQHFIKQIDSLQIQKNFWISDWGIVTGYFKNRKLWALKN